MQQQTHNAANNTQGFKIKVILGTPLMVHLLGQCAFLARDLSSVSDQGIQIPPALRCSKKEKVYLFIGFMWEKERFRKSHVRVVPQRYPQYSTLLCAVPSNSVILNS